MKNDLIRYDAAHGNAIACVLSYVLVDVVGDVWPLLLLAIECCALVVSPRLLRVVSYEKVVSTKCEGERIGMGSRTVHLSGP